MDPIIEVPSSSDGEIPLTDDQLLTIDVTSGDTTLGDIDILTLQSTSDDGPYEHAHFEEVDFEIRE